MSSCIYTAVGSIPLGDQNFSYRNCRLPTPMTHPGWQLWREPTGIQSVGRRNRSWQPQPDPSPRLYGLHQPTEKQPWKLHQIPPCLFWELRLTAYKPRPWAVLCFSLARDLADPDCFLECWVQPWAPQYERHRAIGESPVKVHEDDEGTGASFLWEKSERTGTV